MGFACGVEHTLAWDNPQDRALNISRKCANR